MRKFRIFLAAAGIGAATAVVAASAFAGASKSVPFTGTLKGKAVVRVTGDTATISATGAGTVAPLGKSTLTGKGAGAKSDPCPLFGGSSTITAKGGTVKFNVPLAAGNACTDEAGQQFSLSGKATFAGGTGKYVKAKGYFRFAGAFDRSTGVFTIKVVGSLTL